MRGVPLLSGSLLSLLALAALHALYTASAPASLGVLTLRSFLHVPPHAGASRAPTPLPAAGQVDTAAVAATRVVEPATPTVMSAGWTPPPPSPQPPPTSRPAVPPSMPPPTPPPPRQVDSSPAAKPGYRSCAGIVPLNGTWDAARPPYFFPLPRQCDTPPALTGEEIRACLTRRGVRRPARLFFVGNSFARSAAFVTHSWLTGTPLMTRSNQLVKCRKARVGDAEHANPDAESCVLDAGRNLTLPVLWRRSLGRHGAKLFASDYCDGAASADACHAAFFGQYSDPGDVLFLMLGLGYVERAVGYGVHKTAAFFVEDTREFLASGVFNGTVVWPTLTLASPRGAYAGWNDAVRELNRIAAAPLSAMGAHVLDYNNFISGKPVNETWVDAIHPPAQSFQALVLHAVGELCTNGDSALAAA